MPETSVAEIFTLPPETREHLSGDLRKNYHQAAENLSGLRIRLKTTGNEQIVSVVKETELLDGQNLIELRNNIENAKLTKEQLDKVRDFSEWMTSNEEGREFFIAVNSEITAYLQDLLVGVSFSKAKQEMVHVRGVKIFTEGIKPRTALLEQAAMLHDCFKLFKNEQFLLEHEVMSAAFAGKIYREILQKTASKFGMKGDEKLDIEAMTIALQKTCLLHGKDEYPDQITRKAFRDETQRIRKADLGIYLEVLDADEIPILTEKSEGENENEKWLRKNIKAMHIADILFGLHHRSLEKYSKARSSQLWQKHGNSFTYIERELFASAKENWELAPADFGLKYSDRVDFERRAGALFWSLAKDVEEIDCQVNGNLVINLANEGKQELPGVKKYVGLRQTYAQLIGDPEKARALVDKVMEMKMAFEQGDKSDYDKKMEEFFGLIDGLSINQLKKEELGKVLKERFGGLPQE